MRDILRRYKPDTVEDLTALNALYRPGPMDMIDDFIERKWGRRKVEFLLPELEGILKDSLGVIVYQEQVMRIANVLASYSLGEADLLRRAMGKKNAEAMAKQRDRFMSGAAALGHPKAAVAEIFDQMAKFSGYGFNKSHSAAYALVAYQTAYLKTHYPVEFMAALLTSEISKPENVVKYIKECREMDIPVEPPDVLLSDADFTPHGRRHPLWSDRHQERGPQRHRLHPRRAEGTGRSGPQFRLLLGVLREGRSAADEQARARVADQGRRARFIRPPLAAHRRRRQGDRARAEGTARSKPQASTGSSASSTTIPATSKADALPSVPDWDENQRLQSEKEVLGFFVSGHPLDKYAEKLRNLPGVVDTATALEMKPAPSNGRRGQAPENEIAIAGVIVGLKVAKSKRSGELYAQAALEDTVGKIELICFPKDYERLAPSLRIEVPVLVRGQLRAEEDAAPKLAVSSVQALEDVKVRLPQNVRIRVPLERASEATLFELQKIIAAAPEQASSCSTSNRQVNTALFSSLPVRQ